jgi:hypothetical protein
LMETQSQPSFSQRFEERLGNQRYEEVVPRSSKPLESPSVDFLPSPPSNKSSAPTGPQNNAPTPAQKPNPSSAPATKDSTNLQAPLIELGTPSPPGSNSFFPPPNSGPTMPPATKVAPSSPPAATPRLPAPISPAPSFPPINPGNSSGPAILPTPDKGASVTPVSDNKFASLAKQALPKQLNLSKPEESQIVLPDSIAVDQPAVVTASHTEQRKLDKRQPTDQKVVEIAFHPSLCRGQCLSEKASQDGLYLVLQPRNQSGETIDQPAAVTIVALDPSRDESDARIARWTFSQEEVEASLEPIGISHGFHFNLPWQDKTPNSDRIQVYVRYEMADGRRLINERHLQIHTPNLTENLWTPRVKTTR